MTIFAEVLKEVPMGCKDPLLKNCSLECLTFEEKIGKSNIDNLCLFRVQALYWQKNEKLEVETYSTAITLEKSHLPCL